MKRIKAVAVGMLALCAAVGCAQAPAKEGDAEKPELSAADKALVLDEAPTDIPHSLYIDFGGKVELLGYALEPASMAAPGSKLSLKLYWRSTAKLEGGFLPFTELLTPDGKRVAVEGGGPVRKGALVPANWEPSKVYVDELEVSVPSDIDAARFSIVVGFKTEPSAVEEPAAAADDAKKDEKKPEPASFGAVYLSVLSGPADSQYGGVIATLETGATPGALRAQLAKGEKDKRGGANVKRLPGKLPPMPVKPRPAQPAQ